MQSRKTARTCSHPARFRLPSVALESCRYRHLKPTQSIGFAMWIDRPTQPFREPGCKRQRSEHSMECRRTFPCLSIPISGRFVQVIEPKSKIVSAPANTVPRTRQTGSSRIEQNDFFRRPRPTPRECDLTVPASIGAAAQASREMSRSIGHARHSGQGESPAEIM